MHSQPTNVADHYLHHCRYSVMRNCWETQTELRPSFSELVTRLSSHLGVMADYLDFSTPAGDFPATVNTVVDPFESDANKSAETVEHSVDSSSIDRSIEQPEAAIDKMVVDSAAGCLKTATFESSTMAEDCSVISKSAEDAGIKPGAETEDLSLL